MSATEYIAGLVERARKAQQQIEFASQEEVDLMCKRIAWAGVEPVFAEKLAAFCVEDSGMGLATHKYAKLQNKVKGALRDMQGELSVGIVEEDRKKGLLKVAKPMGVIGAVIPVTNSEATPFVKALFCIKTRNAIIMASHPRTAKTNRMICDRIRAVLKKHNWPEDLVINIDEISLEATKELMKQCDLVLATGGSAMVKAAYSSGTPSQGVGAGNAVCLVDETADLTDAADKIMRSKTFDYATSCSTENTVAIQADVYDDMVAALEAAGGWLASAEDKEKLRNTLWDPETGVLNGSIVAQPPEKIAGLAGIDLPAGKTFIMIEEDGYGPEHPFTREKLSVTMALLKWKKFEEALDLVNGITAFCGPGHSCGIHTTDEKRVRDMALKVRVSRMMIRQPQCLANSGAWTNGMPMTLTLGCGSWGGNSTTENISWKHLLNYTWVSFPIENTQPADEELFGDVMTEKV
jgi:sulfoacetaldehyde dehydrogenase